MGADFRYAGSASYGRLNDELKGIVELFGGKCISEREDYDTGSPFLKPLGYFMEEPLKYEMPEGTPEIVVKWINEPYETYPYEDIKQVYDFLKPRWKEVQEISQDITYELEHLVLYKEEWYLS